MTGHIPVLYREMLVALAPRAGGVYVDATYGGGGYTDGILETGAQVIGLDRDPDAQARAARHQSNKNFTFIRACFGEMNEALAIQAPDGVDGIVLDIGVSSFQIDQGARGFSFAKDGPLDMRMDPDSGESAADVVNTREEAELTDMFFKYGEEKFARRIARAIVAGRPFSTTAQLATAIENAVPKTRDKVHPATRVFQALRIVVNDELGELERGLEAAQNMLRPGGRLVVVTFHSLEDRIVKQFFANISGRAPGASRFQPQSAANQNAARFSLLTPKPIIPSDDELAANPRARSAKLRAVECLEAAA